MAFQEYLTLLEEIQKDLVQVTGVEQRKIAAIRAGDLLVLDECMKQEQVITLSLRGREKRRKDLLQQLGLEQLPLQELPRHSPQELRARATQVVEQTLRAYQVYDSAQKAARTLMESELRQIEKELKQRRNQKKDSAAPNRHQTDFRA